MKLAAMAFDYDGTIATDGRMNPAVAGAIRDARAQGIAALLVTGRRLADLERLLGDLSAFDAIVAENGAMLDFPNVRRQALGDPPPAALLEDLRARGVPFEVGDCVVDLEAQHSGAVLDAVRRLELPLALLFNRGRLMVLPQSISKGTGLREALTALRLSAHNTMAIGDAENDHAMLAAVELGVAVSWGSQALCAIADDVVTGDGPEAVAGYVRRVSQDIRLPPKRLGRRTLLLGTEPNGQLLRLSVQGRNVLIAGDPRSGKSWVAGLLLEQLILHRYCVVVLDVEGDYKSLEALPGVVVMDIARPEPYAPDLARTLTYSDLSVVLELAHMPHEEKKEYVKALLRMLRDHRRTYGVPHRIVVDEAHYFLHDDDVLELLDLELGGYTLVTYQTSRLRPEVLEAAEAVLLTRENDGHEIDALAALCGVPDSATEWRSVLGSLPIDEAVLLPGADEAAGRLRRFRVAPRLTPHVRHQHKYLDVAVELHRAFLFTRDGARIGSPVRTMRSLACAAADHPPEVLAGHLRRRDISRWIAEVFSDHLLADRVRDLERNALAGPPIDQRAAFMALVSERYAFGEALDRRRAARGPSTGRKETGVRHGVARLDAIRTTSGPTSADTVGEHES